MVISGLGLGTFGAVLAFFHLSEFTLAAIFQRAELGWHCKDLDSQDRTSDHAFHIQALCAGI